MDYGNINWKDLNYSHLKIFVLVRILEVILQFLGLGSIFGKDDPTE